MAERSQLSTEAVSLLERGLRAPRPRTVQLLADALQLAGEERWAFCSAPPGQTPADFRLPRYADQLIGRRTDTEETARLLTSGATRLVTLTGPGGVGKTRLTVTAVAAVIQHFPDGVRWVRVALADDVNQLVSSVANALGLPPSVLATGKAWSAAALTRQPATVRSRQSQRLLLVVDGAEGFLSAIAEVCKALLTRLAGLRVLVTSREALHLLGEQPLVIAPLPCRQSDDRAGGDEEPSTAARLFLARAPKAQRRDGQWPAQQSASDLTLVEQICRHVDGVPLAIEQAAARTSQRSLAELAAGLGSSLQLLTTAQADDDIDLRNVMIGDSFGRLSKPEQIVLARLSLFSRSFDQRSATAVCASHVSAPDVPGTLSLLVGKSLVLRTEDVSGHATLRLLRVVREYAEQRFRADPEAGEVRVRYARYFRDLAAAAAPHLAGGNRDRWFSALDMESDNMRRAFAWCVRHDTASALAMVGSLWRWWHLRGHYREGRSLASAALEGSVEAPALLRAPALTAAGMLALLQCDYDTAQASAQEGLDLYSSERDDAGVRWSLALLGSVAGQRGEYTVASQLHEQALVLAKRAQDQQGVGVQLNSLSEVAWLRGDFRLADERASQALEILSALGHQQGIIWALLNLGVAARHRNEIDQAKVFLTHSLQRSEQINYREGVAWSLNQLGVVSRLQGDLFQARAQQSTSLEQHRMLGNRWRSASALDELAAVALATHDPEQATADLGEAQQLRHEIGAPVPLAEVPSREATVAHAMAQLGAAFPAMSVAGVQRLH